MDGNTKIEGIKYTYIHENVMGWRDWVLIDMDSVMLLGSFPPSFPITLWDIHTPPGFI